MANKPRIPYLPAPYTNAEVNAIKALSRGEADKEQQLMAMKWILQDACMKFEFHYYPTDRDTAFALGREFVAQQLVKIINLDTAILRREDTKRGRLHANPRPEEV